MASNDGESKPGNTKPDEGGSWWQSWGKSLVDTVKEKTSTTYEMVQKDLSEFYQTIQTDTAHVVADTATKVQDQIKAGKNESGEDDSKQSAFKQGFASILSSVSESLKTLAQEESPSTPKTETEITMASPVYDRRQAKIYQIQTEVGTYCNEPEGLKEEFEEWQQSFDFDANRTEMSELLVKIPEIRGIYSKLVPSVVSHATFWQRYFYKIRQFELKEERRAALVARAETASLHEEELNWDSDDGEETTEAKPETEAKTEAAKDKTTEAEKPKTETIKVQPESATDKTQDTQDKTKKEEKGTDVGSTVAEKQTDSSKVAETRQDTKDELSFEILSPVKSNLDREISEGQVESDEAEDLPDHISSENVLLSSSSNRSSPSKEDSSSGSSVEVIQKVTDSVDGSVARPSEGSSDKVLHAKGLEETRADRSETASTSSWISVDDEIRVRKSKKEKFINEKGLETDLTKSPESNRNSGSSSSSAVLVEKSECKGLEDDDNDDVDIDLDEDINEEELQKIMERIKSKAGDLDDDNDWEDWE